MLALVVLLGLQYPVYAAGLGMAWNVGKCRGGTRARRWLTRQDCTAREMPGGYLVTHDTFERGG